MNIDLIKAVLAVSADPLAHVLFFVLLLWLLKLSRKWYLLVFLYLFLMSMPIVNRSLSVFWAVPDNVNYQEEYDVGILLLGVSDYKWHMAYTPNDRNGYCNLNQNADRVGYILQQLKNGSISRLILGKNIIGEFDETSCIVDLLQQQGVSSDRITIIGDVRNTLDEVNALKKFLNNSQQIKKVLVVTSSSHMRRTIAFVRKKDIVVDNYATNRTKISGSIMEFVPSSKWIEKNRGLFYEMFAYVGYKVSGDL